VKTVVGMKIPRRKLRAGSSPAPGTTSASARNEELLADIQKNRLLQRMSDDAAWHKPTASRFFVPVKTS
jgi:hypothetical protein